MPYKEWGSWGICTPTSVSHLLKNLGDCINVPRSLMMWIFAADGKVLRQRYRYWKLALPGKWQGSRDMVWGLRATATFLYVHKTVYRTEMSESMQNYWELFHQKRRRRNFHIFYLALKRSVISNHVIYKCITGSCFPAPCLYSDIMVKENWF